MLQTARVGERQRRETSIVRSRTRNRRTKSWLSQGNGFHALPQLLPGEFFTTESTEHTEDGRGGDEGIWIQDPENPSLSGLSDLCVLCGEKIRILVNQLPVLDAVGLGGFGA
jgi:hypothetical protein